MTKDQLQGTLDSGLRTSLTIEQLFSLRTPDEATISPDGSQVAFVLGEWVRDRPHQRGRIWLVDTAGGEPRPLTNGERGDYEPRWSPSGTSLAFLSQRDTGDSPDRYTQIYLMPAASGEASRLGTAAGNVSGLSWSPDGDRLGFLAPDSEESQAEPKVNEPERFQRLWVIRPGSDTALPVTPPNITIWNYSWSPDGKQIAVYYSLGPYETDWYRGQIGIVAATGGAIRQLGRLDRQAGALTWSRDGQRIYYVLGAVSDRPLVGGDIHVQPVSGEESRNLTPQILSSPSWMGELPDGKRLLYVSWSGVSNQLSILDTVTGSSRVLTVDFYIGDHVWPKISATSDLRTFVAIHSQEDQGDDLWLGTLTDRTDEDQEAVDWRRLTRLNPIALETFELARSKRIRFPGADGWEIDGLFTPPQHAKAGTLPPLVLSVHGGPTSAFRDVWVDAMTQLLSAAGYAVLRVNPRGSIGRGRAFSDAVLGDMGGKDFEDLMKGIDHVIQLGLVDGDRLAISGWSYGGFMTAWAITQTQRFKAAIMGAGICDFHSFHAETNISNWDSDFIGADWLENPEVYRERSALTYAVRVTTPTLIVHGEQDLCVPVNQAYAFYRALRERAVPTELAVYPREGHGFREREHYIDLLQRMLRWIERYV
jgi:dipeptidyl aminopeptidase/acylaminoacyl peptidase